jgi:TonB-dependent starch-binding outer membrane protein SusC
MLNATVRRDGFSAFGKGKKFGVFPSMGASWVISGENFMQDITWLELLKLRFSYGKNGNRGVDPYTSLSNIAITQYVFGDQSAPTVGLNPTSFPNPLLGWETTVSTNLGLDFGFLKGRINGSLDFYTRNTSDLLLRLSIPAVNGYDEFFTNIGKMNNKGFEVTLNSVNVDRGRIKWSSTVIYTLNRNKIIELNGKNNDIASRRFIGAPLFSHYDYVFDGIWQEGDDFSVDPTAKPGYIRFRDITGDGVITPDDRTVIGTSQPDFVWAITNNVSYRGLNLSFVFNGRFGGISPNPVTNPGTNFYDRVNVLDVPYWTPENRNSSHPAVGYPNPYGYGFYQSREYVRLQDVTLSYTLPSSILSKLRLGQARVYVSGKNLKTWTKWTGFDPEHGEMETFRPTQAGPLIKSYVLGVNIGI